MCDRQEQLNALECLLFAAKEPMPLSRLALVLEMDETELPGLLAELDRARKGTGLQVYQLAGGYTLTTRPEYAELVARLLQPDPERLSVQALETLAIIAYRQPLTRPEVDEVRGVNSSGAVTSLIDKDLVRVAGRKDAPGRPFLLETTPRFLSLFGLNELSELPELGSLPQQVAPAQMQMLPDPSAADADTPGGAPEEESADASGPLEEAVTVPGREVQPSSPEAVPGE